MLDAGEGCSSSLLRCGADHHLIHKIFISHMHPDHCSGLPMFIQMIYLADRRAPLEIYVPQEGVETFSEWLRHIYIFPEKLPFPFSVSPIGSGPFSHDEHLHIVALKNKHLQGYRELVASLDPARTLESYSFIIDWKGKKIIYSGDLSSLDDLIPYCEGSDLLFLEATHITVDDILPFIVDQRIHTTVLTHIPPELDGEEDAIRTAAEKYGIADLMIATDGLEIPL